MHSSLSHKILVTMSSFERYTSSSYSLEMTSDGRGKGVFTTLNRSAGDILLGETPSIFWAVRHFSKNTCAHCMKYFDTCSLESHCESCRRVFYCSSACQEADNVKHTSVCHILSIGMHSGLTADEDDIFQLCARALVLRYESTMSYDAVLSQWGESTILTEEEVTSCLKVHSILTAVGADVSEGWVLNLYKRDKACGFAMMAPPHLRHTDEDAWTDASNDDDEVDSCEGVESGDAIQNKAAVKDGESVVGNGDESVVGIIRGFGVYPLLGFTNHSCMPNCIRWDNIDSSCENMSPEERTTMYFRSLYALSRGTELLQSYVPLGWDYADRHSYLQEMFGFECSCRRCFIEGKLHEHELELQKSRGKLKKTSAVGGSSHSKSSSGSLAPSPLNESEQEEYKIIQLFLLRHMCTQANCTGTLTPVPVHGGDLTDIGRYDTDFHSTPMETVYECNNCGAQRTYAEFIASISKL